MGIFGKIGKALGGAVSGAVSGGLGGGLGGAVGGVVSGLGKGGGKGRASGGVVRPAGGGGVLPSSLPRSPQSEVRDPGTTEPVEGRTTGRMASAPSRREDRGPYSERAISRRRRFSRALSSRR